jgi:hypothetical protein
VSVLTIRSTDPPAAEGIRQASYEAGYADAEEEHERARAAMLALYGFHWGLPLLPQGHRLVRRYRRELAGCWGVDVSEVVVRGYLPGCDPQRPARYFLHALQPNGSHARSESVEWYSGYS